MSKKNYNSPKNSENSIENHIEQVGSYINTKICEVKAQVIKLVIGTSLVQFIFNYALNMWGLN